MANLYEKRALSNIQSGVKQVNMADSIRGSARSLRNMSQEANKSAENNIEEARELYQNGLNITISSGISKLMRDENLSSNPAALEQEMDKLVGKVMSDVSDDDIKVNLLSDYELKKITYLNSAQKAFNDKQKKLREQALLDTYMNGINVSSFASSNILSGNGTSDDIVNFSRFSNEAYDVVNAKNKDGTYVFSNTQRMSMLDDIRKKTLENVKLVYESSNDETKKSIQEKILNDAPFVINVDGEEMDVDVKSVLGEAMYGDVKKYIRNEKNKADSLALREYNLTKKIKEMEFLRNPTESGLEDLKAINPNMSDSQLERYEEMLEGAPNFEAKTNFKSAIDAEKEVDRLATMIKDGKKTDEEKIMFASDILLKMKSANGESYLSNDDYESISNTIYNMLNDGIFADNVHSIFGKPGIFESAINWILPGDVFSEIEQIGLETTQATMALLASGDIEGAKQRFALGQREAIQKRYPEIPFDKLNVGDIFWYGPAEKAYKFVGYTIDDILVEVDPKSGAVK